MKSILTRILVCISIVILFRDALAQQDPQFTQYMFNTISVNPAYAGSRDNTTIVGLVRSQWSGFVGASETQTLSYDTSLANRVGLGVNIMNDILGLSGEMYIDANGSYSLDFEDSHLAFGLKLGARVLTKDYSKGRAKDKGDVFDSSENQTVYLPTLGTGLYYYNEKYYAGISIPNLLQSTTNSKSTLSNVKSTKALEKQHYFLIAGYVYPLTENILFKPSGLAKFVMGGESSLDLSLNFLFNKKFRAGTSWRVKDAVALLLGFQATKSIEFGYAFDLTTSALREVTPGSHEVFVRYQTSNKQSPQSKTKYPRFF